MAQQRFVNNRQWLSKGLLTIGNGSAKIVKNRQWLNTDDLLALKMSCCQRPKAEGNSSSEGPTDHLLPDNPDNNCFVIPHFLELCSMMNGHETKWSITQHKNAFSFFLFIFNEPFLRQNTNAIAYKNHWLFGIQALVLLQSTQPVLSAKIYRNDAYFRHARVGFFFRRSSNDCSIASRHSFGIFYAVLITNLVFLLSLSSKIIFISSSEALATVRNDHRHL